MFGLDYVSESIAVVKAMNARFVCRYVGYFSGYNVNAVATQQGKCLYTAEAQQLLANDIDIVSNFEWYALRPSIHNAGDAGTSRANGQWDARVAHAIHTGCGGPSSAPIYFSVDYQTDGSDTDDYFKGVADIIGLPRVGAYGSFDCLRHLFDNRLITYGWQTYAWSNGQWEPRAHIHQYSNGNKTSDGGEVDFNESVKPYFGSWRGNMTVIPTGWTDDATNGILTSPNGIKINTGMRDYIINVYPARHGGVSWPPECIPLAPEYTLDNIAPSDPTQGGGTRIDFKYWSLGWSRTKNAIGFMWVGNELAALKANPPIAGDPKADLARAAIKAWLAE